MSLAMAEDELERDPGRGPALLAEARTTSSAALVELRDLVRGIHPPVLADRGLVGAVEALALAAPLPVDVQSDVPRRLPAPVESAAYFAVAEAAHQRHQAQRRHAGRGGDAARRRRAAAAGRATTAHGGADPAAGTACAASSAGCPPSTARSRVTSPPGGPTQLAMVLPCVSSSPKTWPSSGTA